MRRVLALHRGGGVIMVLPGEAETWERWSAAERKRAAQIEDRDRGLRAQARAGSKLAAALLRAYQQRARRERRACRERGEDRVWFARWYARGFALGLSRVDVATNGPLDAATYPECDTIAMFAWDAGVAAGRVALPLPSVVRCTNDRYRAILYRHDRKNREADAASRLARAG